MGVSSRRPTNADVEQQPGTDALHEPQYRADRATGWLISYGCDVTWIDGMVAVQYPKRGETQVQVLP